MQFVQMYTERFTTHQLRCSGFFGARGACTVTVPAIATTARARGAGARPSSAAKKTTRSAAPRPAGRHRQAALDRDGQRDGQQRDEQQQGQTQFLLLVSLRSFIVGHRQKSFLTPRPESSATAAAWCTLCGAPSPRNPATARKFLPTLGLGAALLLVLLHSLAPTRRWQRGSAFSGSRMVEWRAVDHGGTTTPYACGSCVLDPLVYPDAYCSTTPSPTLNGTAVRPLLPELASPSRMTARRRRRSRR